MKNYDPNEVSLAVGPYLIKFDTMTLERDEDRFLYSVGTGGESTRIKNANVLSTLTVEVPQTSSDNDLLSTLYQAGEAISILVKDNLGNTVAAMPLGTISKLPPLSYEKETTTREWMIKGDVPETIFIGGNNSV